MVHKIKTLKTAIYDRAQYNSKSFLYFFIFWGKLFSAGDKALGALRKQSAVERDVSEP